MGQRSFATFVILVSNCVLLGAAKQVKIISNCTLDDLRNINDGHKLAEPSESTSTPSPPPSQPLIKLNLVFEDCDLPTLPDPILVDVPSVQSVNLTHSNLSTISPYALSGLKTLESLIVVANPNLTLLQSWTPHNIVGLIELDLHGNGISELDTLALRRYPQLSNLNLSTNFIQEIPVGFFDFSLNIDTLDLSANLLRRIESNTFKALSRLANINLAYNQINFIDSYAFTTVTRLKRLHLNGNQISTIDSVVFYNLARLQHLDLNSNALDEGSIEKEAFLQNSHLLTLDISNNSFSTIHTTTLGGLTALQLFNASNNQIAAIPSNAFKDLTNLKHLDISHNKFSRLLDNQFAFMNSSIVSINISHNEINSIQTFTFTDLPKLQALDLSANQLQTDNFLDQIVPVKSINFGQNRLRQINMAALKSMGNVFLNDNPWNCSWLLHTLYNNRNHLMNIQFGFEFDDLQHESLNKPAVEEIECFDYRQSIDLPEVRRIVVLHSNNCAAGKMTENEPKKKPTINTYPRTFNKLLSEEFDYKACLLWTVVAVFSVIGLIRLGKYYLEQSEKKSERYRIVQQEKVLKDIDEYFAKNSHRKQHA